MPGAWISPGSACWSSSGWSEAAHASLFDKTLEGLAIEGRPIFSAQYHPEASPGPQDSHYLFERFVALMEEA